MNIFKPMLPAKKGYVEVEVNRKRTYRNIETGELIEEEIENLTYEKVLDTLLGVSE